MLATLLFFIACFAAQPAGLDNASSSNLPALQPASDRTVAGTLDSCFVLIPEGVALRASDDLTLTSTSDIVIDGALLALSRNETDLGRRGVNLTLRAARSITIRGLVAAGDGVAGYSWEEAEATVGRQAASLQYLHWAWARGAGSLEPGRLELGVVAAGGDGGNVILQAPIVVIDGTVLAGQGAAGGPGARGGRGGSALVCGRFLWDGREDAAPARLQEAVLASAVGGDGGPGGCGLSLSPPLRLPAGPGGDGGDAGRAAADACTPGVPGNPMTGTDHTGVTAQAGVPCRPGKKGKFGGSARAGNGGPGGNGSSGYFSAGDGCAGGQGGSATAGGGGNGGKGGDCCTGHLQWGGHGGDGGWAGIATAGAGGTGGAGGDCRLCLGGGNGGNGGNGGSGQGLDGGDGGNGGAGSTPGGGGHRGFYGIAFKGVGGGAGPPGWGYLGSGTWGLPGADGGKANGSYGVRGSAGPFCPSE